MIFRFAYRVVFCFVFQSAGQDALNGAGLTRIGQGFAELQNKNDY